jgi:putative oxidoreductase
MRTLIYPNFVGGRGALGLLVLRVLIGAAFILHGWPKIQDAFHWMDRIPNVTIPPPYLQALAALAEFGGGIGLILGFLTPLAALGIACTMVVAIMTVHVPHGDPFVASRPGGGSFELPAAYLAGAIVLLLVGPGMLSLDALLFRARSQAEDRSGTQLLMRR